MNLPMKPFFKTKKSIAITVTVTVALVAGSLLAAPSVGALIRQNNYDSMVQELKTLAAARVETSVNAEAALVLTDLQVSEAAAFAATLSELSNAPEPVLPAAQKQQLSKVASQVASTVEGWKPTQSQLKLISEVSEKLNQAAKEDSTIPASFLSVTPAQFVELTITSDQHSTVVSSKKDPSDRDFKILRSEIDSQSIELVKQEKRFAKYTAKSAEVQEVLEQSVSALKKVANDAPQHAAAVIAAATKATEANTTTEAQAAEVAALAKKKAAGSRAALQLAAKLKAYVDAAQASNAAHAAGLEQEAAQAAAASGQSGYVNPATGAWVSLNPGASSGTGSSGGSSGMMCWINNSGQEQCAPVVSAPPASSYPGQPLGWNPDGSVTGCPAGYGPGGYGNGKQYCVPSATDW